MCQVQVKCIANIISFNLYFPERKAPLSPFSDVKTCQLSKRKRKNSNSGLWFYGLNCEPQNSQIEVLTLLHQNGTLFGNRIIRGNVKERSQWSKMDPKSNMTYVLIKGGIWT